MPAVQSKESAGGGRSLSLLVSVGLLLGAAVYGASCYLGGIRMAREQCVSCEEPQLWQTRICRGCQREINCCESCWPRYQREVHSRVCECGAKETNLDQRFVFSSDPPIIPSPCRVCGGPAHVTCGLCTRVDYCSTIRRCAMTDWPQHQHECRPDIVQMEPQHGTKSTIESTLPIDLLAHIESYLSFYQWSKAARVNHAWRNASLLPSAGSSQPHYVSNAHGYDSSLIGQYARRSLRQLIHINRSEIAACEELISVQSAPLPHFSHLECFIFYDPSHPYQRDQRMGEYLATMSSTLLRLDINASALTSLSGALYPLTRLRQLDIADIIISEEFNDALSQLTELWSVTISFLMSEEYLESDPEELDENEQEEVKEERRLLSEMLTTLSQLPVLTHMRLLPTAPQSEPYSGCDPLTQLMSTESPVVFDRVTHFAYTCVSCHLEVLPCIRQLGSKFPVLTAFQFTLVEIEDSFEQVQSHLLAAIDSVRDTLTEIVLTWPLNEPIQFPPPNVSTAAKTASPQQEPKKLPLRLQLVQVVAEEQPVCYQQPQSFGSTFVSHLHHLSRLELNFDANIVFSDYAQKLLIPLIQLEHLEHLSLWNIGLVTHDATTAYVQHANLKNTSFSKRRDEHRPLKSLHIIPAAANPPDADIYLTGQVLLSLLPRVEVVRFVHGVLSLASLFRIARYRPVVWLPAVDPEINGAGPSDDSNYIPFQRFRDMQTLSADTDYFSSDEFTSFKLIQNVEIPNWWQHYLGIKSVQATRPHALPSGGIMQALSFLTHDYAESLISQHARLDELEDLSWTRCQHLELTQVRLSSSSPHFQKADDVNSLTQVLLAFAGMGADEIFSTQHLNREYDTTRKTDLFHLMRETRAPLPLSTELMTIDWTQRSSISSRPDINFAPTVATTPDLLVD